MKKIRLLLFLPLIAVLYCSTSQGTIATVAFTGDIIMHIPVKTCSRQHNIIDADTGKSANNNGFDFLFQEIKGTLKTNDVVVGNMEFPVAPPYTSKPFIFNCHPSVLASLKKAGFTMMHTANNHILDQNSKGVVATINHLKEYSFDYIGADINAKAARNGVVKEINGILVGFIGYTSVLNYAMPRNTNGYHVNIFHNDEKVIQDIQNIKERCEYLIMVAHTGDEYTFTPKSIDRKLMKKYIDAGVDLIVGHHPHVLQPIEKVMSADQRECYIFYSLGNFISNQSSKFMLKGIKQYISTRDSIILTLKLNKNDKAITPRFIIEPIRTQNLRDKKQRRIIQTITYKNEIASLQERYTKVNEEEKKKITRKIENLNNRVRAIRHVLYGEQIFDKIEFIEPL
jgi:poly-gamma-glutamate capsule biosynthesis protein CapA/YwtB (metallophosphatase superfamily)